MKGQSNSTIAKLDAAMDAHHSLSGPRNSPTVPTTSNPLIDIFEGVAEIDPRIKEIIQANFDGYVKETGSFCNNLKKREGELANQCKNLETDLAEVKANCKWFVDYTNAVNTALYEELGLEFDIKDATSVVAAIKEHAVKFEKISNGAELISSKFIELKEEYMHVHAKLEETMKHEVREVREDIGKLKDNFNSQIVPPAQHVVHIENFYSGNSTPFGYLGGNRSPHNPQLTSATRRALPPAHTATHQGGQRGPRRN